MKQFQFLKVFWVAQLAGFAIEAKAQFFDPDSAVLVDPPPATGTFIGIYGNFAPLPFCPDGLEIYSCGVADQFWVNDLDYGFGFGLRSLTDAVPDPSGGGTNGYGSDGYTNSYNLPVYSYTSGDQYYSNFWLLIAASPTNSQIGLISVADTIAGIYYSIKTNGNLQNPTNWNVWTTVLATSTNTPCPPVSLAGTNLNFHGQIVFPPSNGYAVVSGLVAYWKLHESQGTNAYDSSGSNNTLSLSNSPYWGPGYVILNGTNQYGDAGTNAAEIDNQDMTICAWINQTSNAYKGIVDKTYASSAGDSGGWSLRAGSDGHPSFYASGFCIDYGPATTIPGQWNFVTVVWHAAMGIQTADFYINGIFNSSHQNSMVQNKPTLGFADLQVGNFQNNASNGLYAFNGDIRDVGIYNRALSQVEVHSNFLSTEYNTNVNLPDVLYYKMTEYNPANPTNYPFSLADSSAHGGTTGTYGGIISTIWTTNVAGFSNSALNFSGVGAYINTSNTTLFNFTTNPFTINTWLQPLTQGGYFMGTWDGISNGWYLAEEANSYKLVFGTGLGQYVAAIDPVEGWPSIYNMVTITWDGINSPLIYINGSSKPTTGALTHILPGTNQLVFGTPYSGANYLDGNIWLTQIWTNALSQRDIANLYQEQLMGFPWP